MILSFLEVHFKGSYLWIGVFVEISWVDGCDAGVMAIDWGELCAKMRAGFL